MDKFVFGITGTTGAGKTTVSNLFRKLGVYVADADVASRLVTKKGNKCLDELKEAFGDTIITCDGELDRRALAEIVFTDASKLQLLNAITHKYIKEQLEKEIQCSDSELAAIDGAVLIGSPVMDMCRVLVVVTADEATRINRITKRDGIDVADAKKRISSQMTDREYISYADYVIENNCSNERLGECVENIYNKIKAIAEKARTQNSQTKTT